MSETSHSISAASITERQLRDAIITISVFVSDTILDPHSGFENLFAGNAGVAESRAELLELLSRLLLSLDEMQFDAATMERLAQRLQDANCPDLKDLRAL